MDAIELLIMSERPVVRADQRSELDVVVEIRCKSKSGDSKVSAGHAVNVAIVLDRSGSMEGEKLTAAKASCTGVLKALRAEDLLTVVVFDDEAEVVVNPQVPREAASLKIASIDSGGQTNLALGWYLGLLELQTHATPQHNNRLLLLSDGQANAGETKKSVLASEASKSRDLGITTSTIGIGDDFQEDLLDAIATESGGRFWYIKESRIEDIIEEEFQGSLSVALDRPRVEVRLPAGVSISRELNQLSKVSGKYRLRPLKGDDYFNLAIRLDIQSQDAADIELTAALYDGERLIRESSNTIRRVPPATFLQATTNPLVASVVQQFLASTSNEQILANMADGDLNLMKKMLIAEVNGMRVVQDALAADPADDRFVAELRHLGMDMAFKGASITVADLLQDFPAEPEVRSYMRRWRKVAIHNQHRMANRRHDVLDFDVDLFESLVQGAIDLVDILIARYPDRAERLLEQQRTLREQLARH